MNYRQVVTINSTLALTFKALTQDAMKWQGKVSNGVLKVGDEFTIEFGATLWKFKIQKHDAPNQLIWECIEAHHIHEGLSNIEKEWVNTTITWKIEAYNGQIKLKMEHIGLTPKLNCYEICESGWNYFILDSLKNYLETGKGKPHLM